MNEYLHEESFRVIVLFSIDVKYFSWLIQRPGLLKTDFIAPQTLAFGQKPYYYVS